MLTGRVAVGQGVRDGGTDGLERIGLTGQCRDDVMVGQRPELSRQVGNHRQLGVRERAKHQPGCDLERRDALTHPVEGSEHRMWVEAHGGCGHLLERLGVELDALLGAQIVL